MKRLLIAVVVIIIFAAGGGVYIYRTRHANTVVSPEASSVASSSPTPQALLTWDDQAGFTFQYPSDVAVNKHDEDEENYAHVELTNKDHPGGIIVWAKDTSSADAASWAKGERLFAGATIFDTTLGGEPGKKVLLTTPTKKMFAGAVSDNIIFYVEGSLGDTEYWSGAFDAITTSFAFVPEKTDTSAGAGDGGSEAVDEEEVLE